MKTTRTLRVLLVLMALAMILPLAVACKKNGSPAASTEDSAPVTEAPTEAESRGPFDAPLIPVDPNASVYSGTPDTSWYSEGKTEFTLTSADQLMGFQELRSQNKSFEGVTVKLGCDMIINKGSDEDLKERGSSNYAWKDLKADNFFKGSFDGQGHTISGVYMQLTTEGYSSMFGSVAGNVTFKDFSLTNSYFGAPNAKEDLEVFAALITQITEEGTEVKISRVNMEITMEETGKKFNKMAGFVGYVDGEVTLKIDNSNFAGKLAITGTHAAGFVGHIAGVKSVIRITTCTNYADLATAQYCGGMIGQSKSQDMKVVDCINRGDLDCKLNCKTLTGEHIVIYDIYEGQHPPIKEGTSALRVMSFNVQTSLPKNSDGTFTQAAANRIAAVREEILHYTPDLLGLQEDSMNWHNNLNLSDYDRILDSSSGSASSEKCAIYYKKGMTLLDSGTHWLTHTGKSGAVALTYAEVTDPNSKFYMTPEELGHLMISSDADLRSSRKMHWDEKTGEFVTGTASYQCTTTRKFSYGVFEVNGQILIYVNTHLTHRSQNADYSNDDLQKIRSFARIKEWDILMGHLNEIKKKYPTSLVFFTGDFNDNKGKPIFKYVTETFGYASAESVTLEHVGTKGSWNNAFNLEVQGDSYPTSQKLEGTSKDYLDYCFVEKGLQVERFTVGQGRAEITLANGSKKFIYTSDHLPVITDLSFKTATTGKPIAPDVPKEEPDDLSKPSVYSGNPDTSWYTGNKTEYTLTTADQFAGMLAIRQSTKATFEGITIKLARDLIINRGTVEEFLAAEKIHELQPLNSSYLFKGTFDGQGHTVSGIYIKCTTSAVRGLFGGLGDNATIKNLTLTNCYAASTVPTPEQKSVLGILAAKVNGTNVLISGVKVSGVMAEDTAKFHTVGALLGRVEKNGSVTLEGCEVSGSMSFGTYGYQCGSLIGTVLANATVNVLGCKSDMNITATNYCGGLIGYDNGATISIDQSSAYTGTIICPGTHSNVIGNK